MRYTIEDFKNGEFVIVCETEEEANTLMKIFEQKNIRWLPGESALGETHWEEYEENTYYRYSDSLFYGSKNSAGRGYKQVYFTDFIDERKSLKEKVLDIIDVKVGEKFNISGSSYNPFYFDEDYEMRDCDGDRCTIKVIDILWRNSKIEKLPEDPNVEVKKYIELLSTATPLTKNIREGILVSLKEILELKEQKSA